MKYYYKEDPNDKCQRCKRPRLWKYKDKAMTNGRGEPFFVYMREMERLEICGGCYIDLMGKPIPSLQDYNEKRKKQ